MYKYKRGTDDVLVSYCLLAVYKRLPLLPPFLRVQSVGMGVTSSVKEGASNN